jgi:nitroreductase
MDVIEAIHGRRSIRAYSSMRVERWMIEELLWAAAQAPTPPVSGEQPWAFCVIEGCDRLIQYGTRAKDYAREHLPADIPWHAWAHQADFQVFWGAPVAVILCARTDHRETPFDCCRAAQNLVLAAHALGLGSCWVGAPLPWLRSPGVAAEVGLPDSFEPSAVVIVGYPNEAPAGRPRPRPSIIWCESRPART